MSFDIKIHKPVKKDAKKIYDLVKSTKVLDLNSEYLYLLQCTHFKDYCAVAKDDEKIIGFVSGYKIPDESNSFFIWQVAVDENYRGRSLAAKLIADILKRAELKDIDTVHTTISPSNKASQRVFEKLMHNLEGFIETETMFEINDFNNAHEDEILYKIKLKKEK